ncbi:MAG TPA: hemerythrin domain-containing protein [Caulobacteraceae bacterium]|nr:hemerythrin domain-containing protein [Caulobacteraceae bacterium]
MARLLEALLEDHRNAERLLNALEHQIRVFAEGEAPDYDIVVGAAEYFIGYPSLCHHPMEDAIARRLLAAHPAEAAAIADLAGEHELVHKRARHLRRTMRELLGDTDIARETVVEAARRFVTYERRHMQAEEQVFFPLADQLLTPADWAAIEAELTEQSDPISSAQCAASFQKQCEQLLVWEGEVEPAQGGVS